MYGMNETYVTSVICGMNEMNRIGGMIWTKLSLCDKQS